MEQGRAGPEDWEVGFRWHEESARLGLPRAMFNMGYHYLTGKGVEKVPPKGGRERGRDGAAMAPCRCHPSRAVRTCLRFALLLTRILGRKTWTCLQSLVGCLGPSQNFGKAAEWFKLAAERGMPEACVNLGEVRNRYFGDPKPK